jgi:glycerate kinase
MNILILCDSFKGSLTSKEAALAIKEGIKRGCPRANVDYFSVADGGEGTTAAVYEAIGGQIKTAEVTSPSGGKVRAHYLITKDADMVMEMAAASGLTLVNKENADVLFMTSFGTGQLMMEAKRHNVKKLYLGIGGSATNDGGMGMAAALGNVFKDSHGNVLRANAASLEKVSSAELLNPLEGIKITVMCDVDNPLLGKNGATAVYGPQKGVKQDMVEELDHAMEHYANVVDKATGTKKRNTPGAGAAGGLGYALMAFTNAEILPGIDVMLEQIGFERIVKQYDLIITGEGSLDGQSMCGKVPVGVAKAAKKYGVPVIALAGGISDNAVDKIDDMGLTAAFAAVNRPMSTDEAMKNASGLLSAAAQNMIKACLCFEKQRL